MKSTVFKLKLSINDVENVYIEIEQFGQNNPQQYEMNLKQKYQEIMFFTCPIKLESEQLYRYRYIQKNQSGFLAEEKFRRFKKNEKEDEDEENLVDEWNKVWNSIQVEFDQKEFFAECEKFQIFRNLRPYQSKKSENNIFHMKQLSDDYSIYEKQQTLTFTNDSSDTQEFQIYKNQEIHLNCVNTIITFGQLGKQLIKQLGPNFKFLLEQVENKFLQKDDQVKQKQQIIEQKTQLLFQSIEQLKEKQSLQEEFEQLQSQSLKKFEEHINQIEQLQYEVEKQKEIALSFQFEQLKVKRIDFDSNNVEDKSRTFDELLEQLQKYQNSLDEIDQLRNQDNSQLESKEKANQFLKKKNEKLSNIILECENQLNQVEIKLNQYEEELKNSKEQQEKNAQTIKALRTQIKKQQEELQQHKDFSNKVQMQLEESEQRQIQLQNDLDISIKLNEEIQSKFQKTIEEDKKKQKQTEESLLENLESLHSKVQQYKNELEKLADEANYLRIEIKKKDEDITEVIQENKKHSQMKKELEERISIFEASKYQRNIDEEKRKNQILQSNTQQEQITKLNEVIKEIKFDESEKRFGKLHKTNENLYNKFFQIHNEQMKVKSKKITQAKASEERASKLFGIPSNFIWFIFFLLVGIGVGYNIQFIQTNASQTQQLQLEELKFYEYKKQSKKLQKTNENFHNELDQIKEEEARIIEQLSQSKQVGFFCGILAVLVICILFFTYQLQQKEIRLNELNNQLHKLKQENSETIKQLMEKK